MDAPYSFVYRVVLGVNRGVVEAEPLWDSIEECWVLTAFHVGQCCPIPVMGP
jgi:hypothetical protein